MTVNAIELLTRVRERIHDRDARSFGDDEILRAMDDDLRKIYAITRTHGDNPLSGTVDVPIGQLTFIENGVHRWTVPDNVGDIQMLELVQTGQPGYQIPRVSREQKDLGRSFYPSERRTVWLPGPMDTVQIHGEVVPYQFLRVTFVRAIPALIHGVQGSTSDTAITVSAVEGAFKARDGAYDAYRFEVVASANAANVGQVRQCLSFAAGVLNFDPANPWPADVETDDVFAMVLPLANQYHEYLAAMVTHRMLMRQGDEEEVAASSRELMHLQHEFEMGISRTSSGEPPRMSSSRWGGR